MEEIAEPTMTEVGTQSSDAVPGNTILGGTEELPISNVGGSENPWSFDPTSLPDDLAREPSLRNFDSVDKLAKSYVHAVRKMGVPADQLMRVPQNEDDPAWGDVYNSIGRPETPDQYAFDERYDESNLEDYKNIAHQLGLTQNQANKILDMWSQANYDQSQQAQENYEGMQAQGVHALQKEWGKSYNENVELARRAFTNFASKEALDIMEDSGLGNHPEIVKMFSKIGQLLKEDGIMVGEPGIGDALSPAMAQEKIDNNLGDSEFNKIYLDKTHPQHQKAVDEMTRLFSTAHR